MVNVRARPVATNIVINGNNELCDGIPSKTLTVTTTGPVFGSSGAFPRQVLIQGPVSPTNLTGQFTVTVTSGSTNGAGTGTGTATVTVAGVYSILGITDGTNCAGTIGGGANPTTLSDGRFTVTPSSNSSTTGFVGCSVSMTANEAFMTPAFSIGTLTRQWQVNSGTGYSDLIGQC